MFISSRRPAKLFFPFGKNKAHAFSVRSSSVSGSVSVFSQLYRAIYSYTGLYTNIQSYKQLYRAIYRYTGLYKAIQGYTQLYRATHSYTGLNTAI